MSTTTTYRLAAWGLMIGAVLVAVTAFLAPSESDIRNVVHDQWFYPSVVGGLGGGALILVAWPAVYLRHRAESGWLGLVAMLLVFWAGMALTVGFGLVQLLIVPFLATLALTHVQATEGPASLQTFFLVAPAVVSLGGVLFGVAALRARVYPPYVGILFVVLAIVSFVLGFLSAPHNLAEVAYMLALFLAGLGLASVERSVVSVPTSAFGR